MGVANYREYAENQVKQYNEARAQMQGLRRQEAKLKAQLDYEQHMKLAQEVYSYK